MRANSRVADFECGYCQRKFSKKEHLKRHERAHTGSKPFKCQICNSSFSRGDVLNRHVRGHSRNAQSSPSESVLSSRGLQVSDDNDTPSYHRVDMVSINNASNVNSIQPNASTGFQTSTLWPSIRSEERSGQYDASSSLLWPDSEEFYQSLVSIDGMIWDQPANNPLTQAHISHNEASGRIRADVRPDAGDDLAAAEDGHRAVQTINGLLANTLFSVTSPAALSDLTPRFLDSSLHMFFTKFVPILPVIHKPTFVYRNCSAPLLLNAIALGSLFLGTEDSTIKGEALWRLAHTAIATSWSELISHTREHDACSGIELVLSSLLSQAYAALSRDRTIRTTSQTFYGLSMHWAQYCGMYDVPDPPPIPSEHDPTEIKMNAWRLWAARETQLRTLLGLCIIDGIVSQFSGNLVNTWRATNSLPLSAEDDVFVADTVDKWIHAMNMHVEKGNTFSLERFHNLCYQLEMDCDQVGRLYCKSGLLNVKILLELIGSLATDTERAIRGSAGGKCRLGAIRALGALRRHLIQCCDLSAADKAIGLIRWHAVCLDLVVNTARGARRMCHFYNITQHIFGGKKRQESKRINPQAWAQGLPARKCLLHALEIHKIASEVPLGVIHDTCLPGALFAAATTYSSFALPGVTKVHVPASIDWETLILYGLDEAPIQPPSMTTEVQDTIEFLESSITAQASNWTPRNLLYELNSTRILLHSLSQHWGVTEEMEEVIGEWEARCG
ncbi:hypothetical protein BU24DRAFT_449471 [Aaosphaeria arxii CBS 175.79]|uniref:C2H2-type domain-containing protein n=1 Tax=Aaosphaeria arxii CBS 175.79 TaxID=1450172 RepID=A0A6A5XY63_9PLEO|nr:uncharacterized protein BU24DRAFT_449471 [Aaosphaeria arxii CBS 175.79]KAF2017896.1 hypothetical protein BU24DRAFT_449471 [Aaosphaeria arxii CBS 175.79]